MKCDVWFPNCMGGFNKYFENGDTDETSYKQDETELADPS